MQTDPTVFVRLPDGQQYEHHFEFLPRVGETIHFDDGTFRVVAVEFRNFPDLGACFYPVLEVDPLQ